jgi:transposase
VPRTRPPYPEEFRREAIRLAQLGDKPQRQLAKDLGISDVTLRHWLKEEKTARGERPGGLSSAVAVAPPRGGEASRVRTRLSIA